ncbi:dodecin domain-containing protein [Legionella yabuuchiae]|uniref:dodecin domain-containing protein n=1 Tax=Legionella yabuuchiae TaxID=376727 RepID=UPI001056A784|nr:dodecin domain-containing protein [Legionella yabuuchiae]
MAATKSGDITGYSDAGISEAVKNALEQAGEPTRFEVIKTRYSHEGEGNCQYQVTLATFVE